MKNVNFHSSTTLFIFKNNSSWNYKQCSIKLLQTTLKNTRILLFRLVLRSTTGNIYHYPIEAIKTLLEPYLPTHLVADSYKAYGQH